MERTDERPRPARPPGSRRRRPAAILPLLAFCCLGCRAVSGPAPEPALPDLQAQWDYDDPAGTEAKLLALREDAARDPACLAELLTQIARARGLQRDFDGAEARLREAEALIETGGPGMDRARVRLLLERGRTLNSSGRPEAARPLFLEAWEVASAAGMDGLAVDAAHMLGIVDPPEEALAWNRTALELAERSADPDARRWIGSLCNNIGWTLHDGTGDFAGALAAFDRALEARRAAGDADAVRIARWCRARCLRSLGRTAEALAIQEELAAELDADGDGFVEEERGECLLALGRGPEARPHFRRAHELLSGDAWLVESAPDRLERLQRLGAGE